MAGRTGHLPACRRLSRRSESRTIEICFWVIEYPDFDSYRQKVAELEKLDWYRYWSC
jgi:hypothetical protein